MIQKITISNFYSIREPMEAIAKYGVDGKKLWEIHTTDHDNLGAHFHPWSNGGPVQVIGPNGKIRNKAEELDPYKLSLLIKVRNYGN